MDTSTSDEPSKGDGNAEESIELARLKKLKLSESPTCVICVESVKSKSFPCSCLHIFCFHCLVKWSKQKNQCPLCKKGSKHTLVFLIFLFCLRPFWNFLHILRFWFPGFFRLRFHHSQLQIQQRCVQNRIRHISSGSESSWAIGFSNQFDGSFNSCNSHRTSFELGLPSSELLDKSWPASQKIHLSDTFWFVSFNH